MFFFVVIFRQKKLKIADDRFVMDQWTNFFYIPNSLVGGLNVFRFFQERKTILPWKSFSIHYYLPGSDCSQMQSSDDTKLYVSIYYLLPVNNTLQQEIMLYKSLAGLQMNSLLKIIFNLYYFWWWSIKHQDDIHFLIINCTKLKITKTC